MDTLENIISNVSYLKEHFSNSGVTEKNMKTSRLKVCYACKYKGISTKCDYCVSCGSLDKHVEKRESNCPYNF